jgi:hypothetical protein
MSAEDNEMPADFLLAAAAAALVTGILSTAAAVIDEEEVNGTRDEAIDIACHVIAGNLLQGRRKRKQNTELALDEAIAVKRKFVCFDRERARECISQDYIGLQPTFGPDDFKRIFRVSRSNYDEIRNYLGSVQSFFKDGREVTNRLKISVDGKILMALKYLAYGCSVNAFRDYFQMGESTAMKCVKMFIKEMTKSSFRTKYFSAMTAADAKRVEACHKEVHGVHGMIGSLDCSHFVWGNCPVAYHGQFQGKEGKPTVVVEAMADHTLYVWHAVFGYAGTLNDLTIWDNSFLLHSICDGSFEMLDFQFTIGGEEFDKLWMLVDGIYPQLSRFVKPISVPLGDIEALYSLWQEAKRKDIERFFGVFKKKFNFFNKPIPFAYIEDVIEAFYTCIILHNMAVAERIGSGDFINEADVVYDFVPPVENVEVPQGLPRENMALQFVQMNENHVRDRTLEMEYLSALGIHVVDFTLTLDAERIRMLPQYQRMAQFRWNQLYDSKEHVRLTKAIGRELKMQYDAFKEKKNVT